MSAQGSTLISNLHEEDKDKHKPTKLSNIWTFWYFYRDPWFKVQDYNKSVKFISTFSTITEFWQLYSHMKRIKDLCPITDVHLFIAGYKPIWEDEKSIEGGKWIIHLRKGLSGRFWENAIIALIGNKFDPNLGICGSVISVRHSEDILSIWNVSSSNNERDIKAKDKILKLVGLPSGTILEYKAHKYSAADNSSFRNTKLLID